LPGAIAQRSTAVPISPAAQPAVGDVGRLTAVSWRPAQALDFAEWARYGRRLGTAGRGASWWIGDWLNYGESKYGEHYSRAAQITRYEVQSLMNMSYVSAHVDISRRRETISWSHHAEVAPLPPIEQDGWLDRVATEGLSVRALRRELRQARSIGRLPEETDSPSGDPSDEVTCPACGHHFRAGDAAAQ
jgi:hypothetical protein